MAGRLGLDLSVRSRDTPLTKGFLVGAGERSGIPLLEPAETRTTDLVPYENTVNVAPVSLGSYAGSRARGLGAPRSADDLNEFLVKSG